MQRKLKLNRMILGGILLGSLSIFGVPLMITHKVCPIGGEEFKDSYIPQCPTNKFVMFKNEFTEEELKKYEKIINSEEYREIPRNSNKYYYLARFYELLGGISDKEIGKTYFTSYHYYSENTEAKKDSLQKGISYLEKAVKEDNEIMWNLADLYYEAEEYSKMNKLLEKTSKKDFGKTAEFYYNLVDPELSSTRYNIFKKEIEDENVKKMIVTKALEFLQKEIKEDRKRGKEIEKQQLLRQAELYRELDKNNEIDALFAKADKKFWKSISLFYMDEPEMYLGNVYNEKKISTAKDLQQALVYADKILSDIEENNSEKIEILLIKAEAYRRLGEFSEAENLLKEIDSEKINEMQKFQFENIKRQVKSKDKRVYQYFPPQVMY